MVLMNKVDEKIVTKTLFELLKGQLEISNCDFMDRKITGIQLDSRLVATADLFIACFGRNHDARNFIDQAIRKGCGAVLAEFTSGIDKLEKRLLKAQRRKMSLIENDLNNLYNEIYPDDIFQERKLNFIDIYLRY